MFQFAEIHLLEMQFKSRRKNVSVVVHVVERRTAVREVESSSPKPDQHSGSYKDWGECIAIVNTSAYD